MKIEDVLKIIKDSFDNNIWAEGYLDFGTPMAHLEGKEDFLKDVEEKIKELNNKDK